MTLAQDILRTLRENPDGLSDGDPERLLTHLVGQGWRVLRVADTAMREGGTDIVAERDGQRLHVEVKGWPSTSYADPARAGEQKRTLPTVQAGPASGGGGPQRHAVARQVPGRRGGAGVPHRGPVPGAARQRGRLPAHPADPGAVRGRGGTRRRTTLTSCPSVARHPAPFPGAGRRQPRASNPEVHGRTSTDARAARTVALTLDGTLTDRRGRTNRRIQGCLARRARAPPGLRKQMKTQTRGRVRGHA